MVSHVRFDFFGTLVEYAPHGPDHDFGRSHQVLRSLGGTLGYAEYRALWADAGERFDAEAGRTGREYSMPDLGAGFLRQALAREPTAEEAATMARAYLADWDTCVRYIPGLNAMLAGLSAKYRLAVVSNTCDATLVPAHLEAMFAATLVNNGQTCYAGTRILAPRSRYAEIVDTFAAFASSLPVGDALDPSTLIGPLVSERQRDRVERYIAKGSSDGARLVAGGGRPAGRDRGWFVEPTVFADVDNKPTIAQEEIFGPVLSVIPYSDVDDAIRIANDSDYGLGGSVWTADPERARSVARRVRTGTMGINGYLPDPAGPWGGVKSSGLGRELGPGAVAA